MKTGLFYKTEKYRFRVAAPLFLTILMAIFFAPGARAQTQQPILPVLIENNFISNNRAESGGGLGIYNASAFIRNNLFIENTSTGTVGGGAIYSFGSTVNPFITGNTLSNNRAASGQGGGIYAAEGRPVISNTILWRNQGDLFNCTASYSDLTTASPGTGNISADPAFVQISDPHAPGYYRLSEASPCIDQGDPSYQVSIAEMDIDGQTRLAGARIDIGADELPDSKGPTISKVTYNGINLIDGMVLQQSGLFSLSAADPSSVSQAEFLLDGNILCTDTDGSNGYTCSWSIHQTFDGAHTLTLSAYDSLGNSSSLSYAFKVALNAPPAPDISFPLTGTVSRTVNITVAGRADQATTVILYQNDLQILSPIAVDSSGNFNFSLTLAEGVNRLRAAAVNRTGTGPMSTEVLVTLDTSLPKAPVNLLAQSRPGGMIGLTWTAPTGTLVKGYYIYRSSTSFSSTSEPFRININPVGGTSLDNLPPSDGLFYYAVSTVDQTNQESPLSNLVSAASDRTPPEAISIEYRPTGPYSAAPLTIGQGLVNVRLLVSEPLLSAPFLSLTANGAVPIPVDLTKVSDLEYNGSFTITESNPGGLAYAVFSARDFIGNRGTTIKSGASFIIDAQGPAIISLDTQPKQPIKNDQANPVSITVTIGLNEALKSGTTPVISYLLSGPGRRQTTIARPIQIATQAGQAQTWQGLFSLPADAGLTTPENGQFFYRGSDDLDNVSSRILCSNSFQIYQGDLPPLAPPANLIGKALAGGKVKLTWKGVAGAMGYRLYRKAPAESTLTPYQTLGNGSEFIDTAQPDGTFRYTLASLRKENNQESVSAMSNTVEVTSDSVPPEAPQDLVLALTGSGIRATWVSSPPTEPVTYSLYRSNLPEITSVQGMTAVLTGLTATTAVDAHPSHTDHSYVVTAVDKAGNESSPSNSFYLNFDLLPVATLQVVQTDSQPPVISWTHSGGDIAGYNLYLGNDRSKKLNTSIITGLSYTDSGYTGDERQYTVTAWDNNGRESLGRTILLPKMYWELKAGQKIRRGIINSLDYTVNNHSASKIEHARLKTLVSTYPHQSQEFMVDANSFHNVSLPVGGFAELPGLVTLATTLEIVPEEGALVRIVRFQEIGVVDDKLILQIRNEPFTRGGSGKIWFTLENTGQEEIEIITAKGGSASEEVTISLADADGNVFSSQAYKQNTGANVVTLSNNDTVARIPVGSLFTSDPIELPIPLTAPDQVIVRVEIGKIRFHYTQPDQISINGLSTQTVISLKDPAYNGTITTITPENSTGDQDILITGRAMDGHNLPVPSVPLKIVITVSGFERSYTVITDNQGDFTFSFRPSSGDSGVCQVRVVHPEVFDKPVQGQFIIGRLAIDPLTVNLTIPKNYEQTVNIRVTASEGLSATDLRLVYEAQDQDSGLIPQGLQVTPGPALTLGPKQSAMLSVKIWADNSAASSGRVFLRLKSAEDDSWGKVVINTAFSEAGPALWSTPDHLETGLAYNQIVTENITLENKGMTALTDVSLSLITESGGSAPNWVRLNSASFVGDLAVGDKHQVSLSFSPTTDVVEGVYPFLLRVVSSNYQTSDIRVYVAVSQAGLGNVIFKVSDIYTGQIQNNQLIQGLAGAKVIVQKETTLQEESRTTDSLGEVFISNLSAGTYKYRVSAANHQEQIGRLWIKPGMTISQQVFLPYNLVTVEWEVRETTIKDKYEIVLQATYETNVPAPVVVMEPKSITLPTMQAGQVFNGEITITNYGLVRADNLKVTAPPSDQYFKYEFLKGLPQSLAAAERLVIPYRVTALRSTDQADEGSGSGGGCSSYLARAAVRYFFQCANGTNSEGWDYSYFTYLWGDSCSRSSTPIHYSASGGSSGGSGSISGPGSQPISGTICPGPRQCALNDPCCNETREAVHSFVDVLRGEYTDTVTDLAVKVLGHSLEVKRRFFDDQWHFDGDYLKLSVDYNSLGNIASIMKDGVRYESSDISGKVFAFKTDRNIYVKDNGYRWETKSGDWSEHDPSGRMTAYGNRNNVKVSLLYEDGTTGRLLGLADQAGTQVLWYEYDSNGSVSAVRDGIGRRVHYYYDGSKRLIKVRDVLGHETLYTYDGAGRMTSRQDAAGRTYTIVYNEYGFVKSVSNENNIGTFFDYGYDAGSQERYVQIKYSSGRIIEKWFDRFGNLIRTALNGRTIETVLVSGRNKIFTDAAGNKTQKEYDARDNLIKQVNPDGTTISYDYEPRFNQVIREVNERGIVSRYEYDPSGNLLRKIEAYGTGSQRITETTCDASGNPLSIKTLGDAKTAEAVTVMTYDGSGRTTSVIDPEGNKTSFTYDAVGNLRTRVDARNKTWTYGYDPAGRLLSVSDPLGNRSWFEYDGVGNKTRETDPEGRERVYLYDPENRVIRSTESAGTAITQFFYNADGKLIRQVDPEGRETRFEYDLDGRLTKTIDGNGNETVNKYADAVGGSSCPSCSGRGAAGQPSKTVFPTFTRTYVYDSRGRKVQETDVLSDTESTNRQSVYDGTGKLLSQIDQEGQTTVYQYDELGHRVRVIDPLNQITEYGYDNRGNLISLKDAKGNLTTMEYDRNNRLSKETRPLGQATRYFYNPLGSLDYKIDARNQKIAYEYDDAGRMIRTGYYASSGDSSPQKTIDFTYGPSGNILSYNDGTTSAGYTYDQANRKLSETVNYGAFELTYAYAYYKNGLKKGLTMPDGTRYDYTYDANRQVSTIGIPGQGVMTYNRYKWTRPETVTLPGGIKRETGYTPLLQPRMIRVQTPAQNPLMTYEYTYSPAGNIMAKNTEQGNYAYQYDPLYRLTNATNPGATEAFTYDAVGNRVTAAISGQPSADSYTHNANNELLSYDGVSYEYDGNGNTTKKTDSTGTTTTYTYDIDNRLLQLRNPQSEIRDYYYDPFGRRLWKEVNGIRTHYLYSDEGLIGEYNGKGTEIKTYGYAPNTTWTTNPLFQKIGTSYYYYQNDHLGTPQKMTDNNGVVVWSASYDAFGQAQIQVGAIENNLRFPGQYFDSETGLYYNFHRYYDPKTGRYVTTDPIGLEGGDFNLYVYVQNRPIKYVDVSGLVCGTGWTEQIVPDMPYGFNFTSSCEWHDSCYSNCGKSKSFCDMGFLVRMRNVCQGYPSYYPIDQRASCMRLADTYYEAVFLFGNWAYCKAQKASGCCPVGCK